MNRVLFGPIISGVSATGILIVAGLMAHSRAYRSLRYYEGTLYFLGLLLWGAQFRIWPPR